MKNIKIIFLSASIFFFASILNVEARDCSDPQGFHEKMMCKIQEGGGDKPSLGEVGDMLKPDSDSGLKKFWNKIKTYGGENVGSEG